MVNNSESRPRKSWITKNLRMCGKHSVSKLFIVVLAGELFVNAVGRDGDFKAGAAIGVVKAPDCAAVFFGYGFTKGQADTMLAVRAFGKTVEQMLGNFV